LFIGRRAVAGITLKGHARSLVMALFDSVYTVSYKLTIIRPPFSRTARWIAENKMCSIRYDNNLWE